MRILAFDVESTGLDVVQDSVIEIGAVLWDYQRKTPLQVWNQLIRWEGVSVNSEIEELTGISNEDLAEFGGEPLESMEGFLQMAGKVDYLMAHNGLAFDQPIMTSNLRRLGLEFPRIPMIDTMIDIPSPGRSRGLSSMLFESEILNYFPHRAFSDALCMVKMASKFNLESIATRAESQLINVYACVDYHRRNLAKDAGFRWNAEEKNWFKTLRECDLEGKDFEFDVRTEPVSLNS